MPDLTAAARTPGGSRTHPEKRTLAVQASELVKTYGKGAKAVAALAGVSFSVPEGSVVGLLGPNGAGKSTAIKILTTLSRADSGRAMVAGVDVQRHPEQVRRMIGHISQKPGFDPIGTGKENLVLQGRIHGLSGREAARRAAELLERFGLTDGANRLTGKWSGGMQRKLDVAMGLIHRPQVLFLDEPTTGLDPEARSELWAEISTLTRDDGLTVLLCTHYLDEADHLAERLVIVDRGRVVAEGTPDDLKAELDGDTILVELASGSADHQLKDNTLHALSLVDGVHGVSVDGATVRARTSDGPASLTGVLATLERAGVRVASVTIARPSLDDVYLRHAGRAYRADTLDDRSGRGEEVA